MFKRFDGRFWRQLRRRVSVHVLQRRVCSVQNQRFETVHMVVPGCLVQRRAMGYWVTCVDVRLMSDKQFHTFYKAMFRRQVQRRYSQCMPVVGISTSAFRHLEYPKFAA